MPKEQFILRFESHALRFKLLKQYLKIRIPSAPSRFDATGVD